MAPSDNLASHVERLLAPWAGRPVPGMAVGVVSGGELVLQREAGLASLELGVPIGPDTTFRIASVSKQFTCAAILLLAAEGLLSPLDDIRAHLPEMPDMGAAITVAHLMHNTSGLRDMLEIMRYGGADLGQPCTTEDLLAGIHRQRGLNFAPGSRYLYSNTNFLLLGRIAERLSGESLPSLLERRIFRPLGMARTRMTPDVRDPTPGLATGYFPHAGGAWRRAAHAFPLGGEGGLVSGVADLALWCRNFSTGAVGGPGLAEALERQTPFTNGTENNYARGLQVIGYRGLRTVSHGGLWPGYKTRLLRVPELDAAIIAISNNAEADPYHLAQDVLDHLIEALPAHHPVAPPPPRAQLERWAGCFVDEASGDTVDIGLTANATLLARTHGLPFRLVPTADRRLAASRANADFTAALSEDGRTLEVEEDAGVRVQYRRVTPGGLPQDLPGRYVSDEIAATWTIAEAPDGMEIGVAGPLVSGATMQVHPIRGDVMRIVVSRAIFETWFGVRIVRDGGGAITGLHVNGGRARGVMFQRESPRA